MGEALIRGFLATGVSKAHKICASVRNKSKQQALAPLNITLFGDALQEGASQVAQNSEIIFLAVCTNSHPQNCCIESMLPAALTLGATFKHLLRPVVDKNDANNCHYSIRGRERRVLTEVQIKPQYLDSVMESLKPHITERHLIISIVAGVKIAGLESGLPEGARVVSTQALAYLYTASSLQIRDMKCARCLG